jgi:hypothetical protein
MLAAAFLAIIAYTDQLRDQKGTPQPASSTRSRSPASKSAGYGPH